MWNGCWKKPKNNAGAIMAAALFFERIEAMRHFYHLTHDDRIKIEALLKEKHTPKGGEAFIRLFTYEAGLWYDRRRAIPV